MIIVTDQGQFYDPERQESDDGKQQCEFDRGDAIPVLEYLGPVEYFQFSHRYKPADAMR